MNSLFYGDNLYVLREHIPDVSVDLIYLDPPFNSKADYNILFKEQTGESSGAQITAFEDTWHWNEEAGRTFQNIVDTSPASVVEMMTAFKRFVGLNDMMAYLTMMCVRLVELRRVLKNTGSIYLHCDPTASHYLKILMDAIFGKKNFRNEIVWCYRGAGYPKKDFGRRHDIIFRYCKSSDYIFNLDDVREEYAEATKERFKHYIGNIRNGKDFGTQSLNPLGKQPDDWWQIQPIAPSSGERLGYPTQKPEVLLEKIILASSNADDTVLDPFCGCGTTITAAQKLKRQWIGIDITHLATNLIKKRLKDMFDLEPKKDYLVIGEPEDLTGAEELANQNRYQFQWWALSLINARPYGDKKKGKDTGIDGYIYFNEDMGKVAKCIVSVKSGNVSVKDIRDLGHVMDREQAELGIFITLKEPTRDMNKEAAGKGLYRFTLLNKDYARIQILTIEDLFNGKKPDIPSIYQISTYKKAEAVDHTDERLDF
ncbi:DNA methyltransferase [Candidatus Magnetominusculus xianensis]|uniref:Methyltransferase n=1 Tax=Candidatus Magnetominusculus xianensis TaxID=1748249 RepID=A0ABR5SCD7_9BACT|nr:DNA methyltransferase [Candidatus Magnetominusculus xianensis]KWT79697.1 DNA methylase [Candidatus Magnetominusculus xianensis]MBF0404763.1 restriction endonuclease [Nitrospirota bacterium]